MFLLTKSLGHSKKGVMEGLSRKEGIELSQNTPQRQVDAIWCVLSSC
jgi:hypothetical protein